MSFTKRLYKTWKVEFWPKTRRTTTKKPKLSIEGEVEGEVGIKRGLPTKRLKGKVKIKGTK